MREILPKVSTKVKVADKISFLKFRNSEKAKKLKKNLPIQGLYYDITSQIIFVHFLEEVRKTKIAFEII